VQFKK